MSSLMPTLLLYYVEYMLKRLMRNATNIHPGRITRHTSNLQGAPPAADVHVARTLALGVDVAPAPNDERRRLAHVSKRAVCV